jgi:replicative DNA helicase
MMMQHMHEITTIGDILVDPTVLPMVRQYLPDGSHFLDPDARRVYDAILAMHDEHGGYDLPAIAGRLEKPGSPNPDLMIYVTAASPALAGVHAKLVAEGHMKRMTIKSLTKFKEGIEAGDDLYQALTQAATTLSDIKEGFRRSRNIPITEIVHDACDELEEVFSGKRSVGLPFGFSRLDNVTGGMDDGDLVVLAAPEKSGKSTLMIQVVFYNANRGTPSVIFSSEMSPKQILYRKALMDTKLRWIDVKRNRLRHEEKLILMKHIQDLAGLPIFIRPGPFTILDIMTDVDRLVHDKGVRLVAVDYIQRVVPVSKKANENREREVAAISSGLKNIAMEHAVPVLALSQVNEDLRARESRAIEQDMDKMITLDHRPEGLDRAPIIPVPLKLRQRMGLSGNMGDIDLRYDLLNGIWEDDPVPLPVASSSAVKSGNR